MENQFDSKELAALKEKYGKTAIEKEAEYTYTYKKFFNEFKHNIQTNRRGEVAFFLERKNGKFVLIRTSFYPKKVYRVPTGGINYGESVEHALFREIKEELGVQVEIKAFLGLIRHTIHYEGENALRFYSYVFRLKELSGNLIADATEEEISEYIEADRELIASTAQALRSITGKWKDWSSYRFETTSFILPFLK